MSQSGPIEPANRGTVSTHRSYLTAAEFAQDVGRSEWWVKDQARRGLIKHYRKGEEPLPGRRDTRPMLFRKSQVREVARRINRVERIVPAEESA